MLYNKEENIKNCNLNKKLDDKPFLTYVPLQMFKERGLTGEYKDTGLIITADNWPKNLIHNPDMKEYEDVFWEEFCSDKTFIFFSKSAIKKCGKLLTLALENPDKIWEHSDIMIFDVAGGSPESWMVRTRTEIWFREYKG